MKRIAITMALIFGLTPLIQAQDQFKQPLSRIKKVSLEASTKMIV